MKSIRRHLLIRLLLWLSLLCVFAVAAFVFASRRSLVAEFDRGLIPELANARLLLRPGPLGFNNPANRGVDVYIQAWDSDTRNTLYKSANLGRRSLPFEKVPHQETHHQDATLEDGELIRIAANGILTFTSGKNGNRGNAVVVSVAKNRSALESAVRRLTIMASLIGGLGTLVAVGIAKLTLERGIRPLDMLGQRVDDIDPASLRARLETDGLADELRPFALRINDLLGRLEKGFERERRFNADLSHELRTPIAEIRSTAEFAALYPDRSDPEDYQSILDTAKRLQGIVESQLALARIESDHAPIETNEVDLVLLVQDLLESSSARAETRSIQFDTDLPDQFTMQSNADLLRTILGNLIGNAIDYSPEDSTVKIRIPKSTGDFSFLITNPAPELEQEDLTHLFERLWRKDSSRTEQSHSGLGLSLVRSCSNRLGFRIDTSLENGLLTVALLGNGDSIPGEIR